MRSAAVLCLVGCSLIGCDRDEPSSAASADRVSAPAEAPPQKPQAPEHPSVIAANITFDARTFGPIERGRAIAKADVEAVFPGVEAKVETKSSEGVEYQVLTAYRGKERLFTVEGQRSIRIFSPSVKGPGGLAVGADLTTARAQLGELQCSGGVEEQSRSIVCHGTKWPDVSVFFTAGDGKFYDRDVPPDQIESVVGDATIESILWSGR